MRFVWVRVELTDDQAAMLESPSGVVMVVPMLGAEVAPFGAKMAKLSEAVTYVSRCLASLRQILESHGDKEGQIRKTLELMHPAMSDADIILNDVRAVLAPARFAKSGDKKGRLQ